MEILCALAFALGVITLVGHGIWVLLATIFGGGQPSKPTINATANRCPLCDAPLPGTSRACRDCGWPEARSGPRQTAAGVQSLQQKLVHLHNVGLIDAATFARLDETLRAEQMRLRPAAPTAPQRVEPPHVAEAEVIEAVLVDVEPTVEPPRAAESATDVGRDVRERTEQYAQQRRAAAAVVAPPPVVEPSKPWSELFASFMEDKNIRWGEIVGGLLIVGSSIALVISFWSQIAERPFLKFFVFNGVTAALFALGYYIHRHWKLATTSAGLMLIATLLVPLNFLALAAFTSNERSLDTLSLVGEAASIGIFSFLVWLTGQIMNPRSSIAWGVGVVGCSVSQLLIRRLVHPAGPTHLLLAAALLPLGIYLPTLYVGARRAVRGEVFDAAVVHGLFKLLGVVSFAALTALALLVFKSERSLFELRELAPLLTLLATPSLAVGCIVWQRLTNPSDTATRVVGTSLAVAGGGVMLGAIVLAWPEPLVLDLVAIVDFAILTLVAWRFAMPAAHAFAALAIVAAYVVTLAVMREHVTWRSHDPVALLNSFCSALTGTLLTPLFVLLAAAAGLWSRAKCLGEAKAYGLIAAVTALASITLVSLYGFGRLDDGGATWVYALYALGSLIAARFVHRSAVAWLGSALLAAALAQGTLFAYRPEGWHLATAALVAALAHAALMTLGGALARWRLDPPLLSVTRAIEPSAFISLALAVVLLAYDVAALNTGSAYLAAWGWSAIALLASLAQRDARLFTVAHGGVTAAVVLSVVQVFAWKDSTLVGRNLWWHPLVDQTLIIALALLGVLAAVLRRLAQERLAESSAWRSVLFPPWPSVDRVTTDVTVVAQACMALVVAAPVVAFELSRRGAVSNLDALVWSSWTPDAVGWPAALAFASCLAALVALSRERPAIHHAAATVGVLFTGCLWLAASQPSCGASTLRWSAAAFLLLGAVVSWNRHQLAAYFQLCGWEGGAFDHGLSRGARRAVLLMLPIATIIGLTLVRTGLEIDGEMLHDVGSDSFFARIGREASYLSPLCAIIVVLVGYAIRERHGAYALGGGLTVVLTTSLAYMLGQIGSTQSDWSQWIEFGQFNAGMAASYAMLWYAWLRWQHRHDDSPLEPLNPWLSVQLVIVASFLLFYSLVTGLKLLELVTPVAGALAATVGVRGLAVWLLASSALLQPWGLTRHARSLTATTLSLLCGSTLLAAQLTAWVSWGYLAWIIGLALSGAAVLALAWRSITPHRAAVTLNTLWVIALLWLVSFVAIFNRDPHVNDWAMIAAAGCWLLMSALACWSLRRRFVYLAAGLFYYLAILFHEFVLDTLLQFVGPSNLVVWLLGAGLVPVVFSWWFEVRWRPTRTQAPARGGLAFHRLASWGSLALLLFIALGHVVSDRSWERHEWSSVFVWSGWASVCAGLVLQLWDPRARGVMFALYLSGVAAIGLAIGQIELRPEMTHWLLTSLLAAYAILTSYLWSRRAELLAFAQRVGIEPASDDPLLGMSWLLPLNVLMALGVIASAFSLDLRLDEQALRIMSGKAAVLQVVTLALLARGARRSLLQRLTLCVGVLGAVAWGWAWPDPHIEAPWIHRTVIVLAVLVVAMIVYGLGLAKLLKHENDWTRAAQALVPTLFGLSLLSIAVVLGSEIYRTSHDLPVVMRPAAIGAVAAALALLVAASLVAALVPGRDPFQLSERGRTAYVYAAEGLLVLLFTHIRLSMPWLFHGFFSQFWPLIVMAIAFVGVGLGEVFRRQGRRVLAEPLERTGALMPLLPVLGFWVVGYRVNYSGVLLVVGVLYGVLAMMRKSFAFSILAALAANGGLWYLLQNSEGYGLAEHPQLWLIPPALCVLVAAYLNRSRLSDEQMTMLRYLTSTTIYASSTADIFLKGVSQSPYLPLVLGGLAIVGVLAGIVLRVRAFLFLGASFLVLSLFTIIWYAAVDLQQTWLWAASGIVTGIAIIAVFAVFEKKRDDVLRMLDELKRWKA